MNCSPLVAPARVQQVLMPDAQTLTLELYAQRQRRYLSLHVQGPDSWLALQAEKPRRGEAATTPMLELLRKYGRGGLLTDPGSAQSGRKNSNCPSEPPAAWSDTASSWN